MKPEKTADNTKNGFFSLQSGRGSAAGSYDAETELSAYSEYSAGGVFESDASDAAEYLATLQRTTSLDPEMHLILAFLEDGVLSFQKNLYARTREKRRQFEEAEAWILDENDDALFSFESTCSTLGIDASYLRRGLMAWKKEKAKERTSAPAKAA